MNNLKNLYHKLLILLRIRKPLPTVNGVVGAFNKAVDDLHLVADVHNEIAAAHAETITFATQAKAFAETEAARAKSIAAKMTAVFN